MFLCNFIRKLFSLAVGCTCHDFVNSVTVLHLRKIIKKLNSTHFCNCRVCELLNPWNGESSLPSTLWFCFCILQILHANMLSDSLCSFLPNHENWANCKNRASFLVLMADQTYMDCTVIVVLLLQTVAVLTDFNTYAEETMVKDVVIHHRRFWSACCLNVLSHHFFPCQTHLELVEFIVIPLS